MILTVGDITSLVSSTSSEEFSHAPATSREVSSATATVVGAGTAAASATTPVVTDVTSLCRQAGTLNPAGPGHLHPRPLDLSSGSVRGPLLVAFAAIVFSRISRSKRSTTLSYPSVMGWQDPLPRCWSRLWFWAVPGLDRSLWSPKNLWWTGNLSG